MKRWSVLGVSGLCVIAATSPALAGVASISAPAYVNTPQVAVDAQITDGVRCVRTQVFTDNSSAPWFSSPLTTLISETATYPYAFRDIVPLGTQEGDYEIGLIATLDVDCAGTNTSHSRARVRYDATPPSLFAMSSPAPVNCGASRACVVVGRAGRDLSWTSSSDSGGSGLDTYLVEMDRGRGFETISQGRTTTLRLASSDTLNRAFPLRIRALDRAGNARVIGNLDTVLFDPTPPQLSVDALPAWVSGTRLRLRATAQDGQTGSGVASIVVSSRRPLTGRAPRGDLGRVAGGIAFINTTRFVDGAQSLTVTATDVAGNMTHATRTVRVDNTKPVFPRRVSPIVLSSRKTWADLRVQDPMSPQLRLRLRIRSGAQTVYDRDLGTRRNTRTHRIVFPRLTPGRYTAVLIAQDLAGNIAGKNYVLRVRS